MPRTDAASGPPSSSRSSAASRISSSVRARRGPRRRRTPGTDIGRTYPLDVSAHTVEPLLYAVQILYVVQVCTSSRRHPGSAMTTTSVDHGLRRTTGTLFVAGARALAGARAGAAPAAGPPAARGAPGARSGAGALAFAGAATVLSSTFDWPDVLREPADVVLPAVVAAGARRRSAGVAPARA